MDVLILLDKLDDLIYSSKAIPLTEQVRVDREAAYSLLDQIRVTMPEEIKQARSIVKEQQEGSIPTPERRERSEDGHLQEIAESIEALKRSQRAAPPPLTAAASEKVRSIVEAAEASAAEVRAEAERDARRIKSEAARRGMEMRKRSAAEAAARLKRADEVTASLIAEAASATADIDSLLDRVRAPAMALANAFGDGATKVEANFDRMRALISDAPVGDEWQGADPDGEIVARREEGASHAGSAEEDVAQLDDGPQSTEEWSYEEAIGAETELDEAEIGAAPLDAEDDPEADDGLDPPTGFQGGRFEASEQPHHVRQ
jgi:cell division septum initiation protein DivIVA